MNGAALPPPLVPAEVDLRGLEYMPLLGARLFGSDFDLDASDAEFRVGLRLWWAAWNQVPAGSLPSEDHRIRGLAGLAENPSKWNKVRDRALGGFVKCSDGRLYHPIVAEQALIAWDKRAEHLQERENEAERQRRVRADRKRMFAELRAVGVTPKYDTGTTELRELHRANVTEKVTPHVTVTPIPPVTVTERVMITAKTGRDGTGHKEQENNLLPQVGHRPADDAPQLALVDPPAAKPKGPPDCPHARVLVLWAQVLPSLPQHDPEQWRGARADHLRARWRETAVAKGWADQDDGIEYLRKLFAYVGRSAFLTGRTATRDPSRKPFVITLAWLVRPENWAKTIEGEYHQESA